MLIYAKDILNCFSIQNSVGHLIYITANDSSVLSASRRHRRQQQQHRTLSWGIKTGTCLNMLALFYWFRSDRSTETTLKLKWLFSMSTRLHAACQYRPSPTQSPSLAASSSSMVMVAAAFVATNGQIKLFPGAYLVFIARDFLSSHRFLAYLTMLEPVCCLPDCLPPRPRCAWQVGQLHSNHLWF